MTFCATAPTQLHPHSCSQCSATHETSVHYCPAADWLLRATKCQTKNSPILLQLSISEIPTWLIVLSILSRRHESDAVTDDVDVTAYSAAAAAVSGSARSNCGCCPATHCKAYTTLASSQHKIFARSMSTLCTEFCIRFMDVR